MAINSMKPQLMGLAAVLFGNYLATAMTAQEV